MMMEEKKEKILIVEDTPETAQLLQMYLNPRGYETFWVSNGSEALGAVIEKKPDLVLLDVMLPGMDGYSIQSQLLENEETKHIPIIMMTSKGQMEEVFKTATNVADFIEKPFTLKLYQEKIETALKNRKKV
jgi:two-component system, OmpR family, alkaline phosphatase synthesis response regulator PhoP